MATVNFGGLATGMDTNSLITQLLELERIPLNRLETEKSYLTSRLSAFESFETKLEALQTAAEAMDTSSELRSYSASVPSEDYISVSASSTAEAATYNIEVVSLAQQEKEVTAGVADVDTTTYTGTLAIGITSDGTKTNTDIAISGKTLTEIVQAINDSDAAVSASIINDGTGTNPYRLVITADNAGDTIAFEDAPAPTTDSTGDFDVAGALEFTQTAAGSKSSIKIDGITVEGTSNTIDDAIEGVTIDLNQVNAAAETTTLTIGVDSTAIKGKIETFVSKYNDIINFISEQADSSWGRDQALMSTKRRLQALMVTKVDGTGSFNYLTELGLTTNQKTGNIEIDSTTLTDAINDNLVDVEKLIVGETGIDGVGTLFSDYLDDITDSVDGLYAARKNTTDSSLRWLENRITTQELRLEKREEALRAQFSAMEELVSAMNNQSSYLAQQLSSLSLGGSTSS